MLEVSGYQPGFRESNQEKTYIRTAIFTVQSEEIRFSESG